MFISETTTTGAQMQVGDLVKKRGWRSNHPDFLIGVVVKVEPSCLGLRYLVNFGDYGTFRHVPGLIELLS